MKITLVWVVCAGLAMAGPSSVSGHVLGPDGKPVAAAKVFLQAGDTLRAYHCGSDGSFRIDGIQPGVAGVFAIARGLAFGGATIHPAPGENISDLTIRLGQPDTVSGKIVDPRGHAVAGAKITGVALLGSSKVGIPLLKLEKEGFPAPVSGANGRFIISSLPKGQTVAIKVDHFAFAQEAVTNIATGDTNVRITLSPGVLLRGAVVTRDHAVAVMNAAVTIKNAQPPHDSVTVASGLTGAFTVHLKPGMYLVQAAGGTYQSSGWEPLAITGKQPEQNLTLRVAGVLLIYGKVLNALSGGPVSDARLTLVSNGTIAAVAHTGPTGEYEFQAVQGEDVVKLDSAPGYAPPTNPAIGVTASNGKPVDMPAFWLAPVPTYKVQIVDAQGKPVPGVVVQVLRPVQFGWNITDAEGRVTLRILTLPAGGQLVGMAEHPSQPLAALFELKRPNDTEAKVQLLPLCTVRGRVVAGKDKPVPGAVVGALFAQDSSNDALLLWRTLSREDGTFEWPAAVPFVPQRCVVYANPQSTGQSKAFNAKPGQTVDLSDISVPAASSQNSVYGKPLRWYDNHWLGGERPKHEPHHQAAMVVYCAPQDAAAVTDAVTKAKQVANLPGVTFAVVVTGDYSCGPVSIPVLKGQPPTAATTYLTDADGKVVLETFGLPPLNALRSLGGVANQ